MYAYPKLSDFDKDEGDSTFSHKPYCTLFTPLPEKKKQKQQQKQKQNKMCFIIVFDFSQDDRWKQWLYNFFFRQKGKGEGDKQGVVWSIWKWFNACYRAYCFEECYFLVTA